MILCGILVSKRSYIGDTNVAFRAEFATPFGFEPERQIGSSRG